MDIKKTLQYKRVSTAAADAGVHRTTLIAAIDRGEIPVWVLADGLPIVRVADIQRWSQLERRTGPKS